LIALCEQIRLVAPDEYRKAMWQRREHLHDTGQHDEAFDGIDALKWPRAVRQEGAA
jgi:hypothetical protein